MKYTHEQINNLPIDNFYRLKIKCGNKAGETKNLNITPEQLKKILGVFKCKKE